MDLEKQFAEELKANNASIEAKMNELGAAIEKGANKEEITSLKSELEGYNAKAMEIQVENQKQIDELSVQFKKATLEVQKANDFRDPIAVAVKENFEAISTVSKGAPFEVMVQKDMTLPVNLVGDQPRDYNYDVVKRPAQLTNAEDLMRTIPISGGSYTFTRSTLAANNIATQTEGALKGKNEYTYTMVDANTDFIAGFSVYSRKMRNNLPFLENTLGVDLRRDYYKAENSAFNTILAAQATASAVVTGNKIERLIAEIGSLADGDFMANGVVVRPSDYYDILITEASAGAGYGLPGVVTFNGGLLRINGIPIYLATWLPANKYYVGDWSRVSKIVTEGFSFTVSEEDADNFRKNNITAKVEAQVTCVVEQPDAVIFGDFTTV